MIPAGALLWQDLTVDERELFLDAVDELVYSLFQSLQALQKLCTLRHTRTNSGNSWLNDDNSNGPWEWEDEYENDDATSCGSNLEIRRSINVETLHHSTDTIELDSRFIVHVAKNLFGEAKNFVKETTSWYSTEDDERKFKQD